MTERKTFIGITKQTVLLYWMPGAAATAARGVVCEFAFLSEVLSLLAGARNHTGLLYTILHKGKALREMRRNLMPINSSFAVSHVHPSSRHYQLTFEVDRHSILDRLEFEVPAGAPCPP